MEALSLIQVIFIGIVIVIYLTQITMTAIFFIKTRKSKIVGRVPKIMIALAHTAGLSILAE